MPELLAPAGSEEALYAAMENGADAVYFGLAGPDNFNARVRAKNIPLENLDATMGLLHRRGVKGYVTLNTLVRCDELPEVENLLRQIASAGVDAIIVQDFGLARLARRLCPELPIHASTQMSLTSRFAIETACTLGIQRVILPRELSIEQIRRLREKATVELEVFCHGALCMSFSGQCYASLALGGRSANRGRCAQPCRMSYDLLDAETGRLLTDSRQLLSPCDLASLPLLPELIETGVHSLKIEGRLKPAEYVAEVTRIYRQAIDRYENEKSGRKIAEPSDMAEERRRLEQSFSRGFSTGWLENTDPKRLVPGTVMSHRGAALGTVVEVRRDAVVVTLTAPVRRGDGVLFENDENPENSQGGRVYEIIRRRESVREAPEGARVLLTFANHSIDDRYVHEGQSVRKTDDPHREREIRKGLKFKAEMRSEGDRLAVDLDVRAITGKPLIVEARCENGAMCRLTSDDPLEEARKHALSPKTLREQFARLGETDYFLCEITTTIEGGPMVPLSVLGSLRKKMIELLDSQKSEPEPRPVRFGDALDDLRTENSEHWRADPEGETDSAPVFHLQLHDAGLFRDEILMRKIIAAGCRSFYGEFREIADYRYAVDSVRNLGGEFVAVLPRVIKPGETTVLKKILAANPDGVLARNLEEVSLGNERQIPVIADFSLNVVNDLSFRQLLDWGVSRITPGWDLTPEQLAVMLDFVPGHRIEQVLTGRIPLFFMEHCLWRGNSLTQGPDRNTCGRVCRVKPLQIRDRRGALHWVRSDIFCRNIIENSQPLDEPIPLSGVKHFRIQWDARLGDPSPLDTLQKILQRHLF